MAAKKSRGKTGGANKSARKGGAKKSAKRSGPKKSSAGKSAGKRSPARKSVAKKSVAKKGPAKKSGGQKRRPTARSGKQPGARKSSNGAGQRSPIQRVRSVARQVAQQAQAAVTEGVGALREIGENIAERVSGQD